MYVLMRNEDCVKGTDLSLLIAASEDGGQGMVLAMWNALGRLGRLRVRVR